MVIGGGGLMGSRPYFPSGSRSGMRSQTVSRALHTSRAKILEESKEESCK